MPNQKSPCRDEAQVGEAGHGDDALGGDVVARGVGRLVGYEVGPGGGDVYGAVDVDLGGEVAVAEVEGGVVSSKWLKSG